ncbi:lipopolysaccharide export system permease protein [Halomonas ventosae]|uniref:Lipopolysaccharide export system permease protein n=2 Tax=Halomonadaceae TaxID=28256 RepID=A0A4R6HH60_9GAMM|nr:lipopolysaccharide export system permease protein [Halomonas ventosae]
MFDRLDRYIARNVLMAMLVVQALLLGLDLVINYITDLEDVEGSYGALQVFLYALMRLPWRFYQYAPVSVLIGALVGLGAMASSNELTVMRAAGRSLTRILWGVMQPLVIVIVITMAVGEYAAPVTEQYAKSWRAELQQQGGVADRGGGWQREGDNFYRFGSIRTDNTLIDMTRYRYDGKRLVSATHAARAVRNEGHWQLQDVRTTRFKADRTLTEQHATQPWQTSLDPELLRLIITDPDSQSISDLWRYAHYLGDQGLAATDSWLYFWQKLLLPLTLASLLLVAASFVFGPLRTVAAGTRVFYGAIVGLSFKYIQDLLAPAATIFGFSPIWAILTPTLASFALGFVLLRRAG